MRGQRKLGRNFFVRYGGSVFLSVAALVMMHPFETSSKVTALQIPLVAVALSSCFFGFYPGILCVVICALAVDYLYLQPFNSFSISSSETVHWFLFITLALVLCATAARLRTVLREARSLRVQFENLYIEAKKAVKTREDVLAIVSHDLRNDLGTIMMNAELLMRNSQLDPKRCAAMIIRAGERMNGLIENLLSLAKIEAGHLALNLSSSTARSLSDEAIELVAPLAAKKSIQLERSLCDEEIFIECDRSKAIRVFSNLLGNAIKFVDNGGRIILSGKREDHLYCFAIQDTGPGISEQALSNIFNRFWQADKTSNGTGLGLSIVKGIVEAHHGKVWVKSKPGEGSTFYFTLPLKQRHSETSLDHSSEKRIA
jgi:signal transduction histidine kinase